MWKYFSDANVEWIDDLIVKYSLPCGQIATALDKMVFDVSLYQNNEY